MINLSRRFCYLLLILIGLIAYLNSFPNSFVWDDEILIIGNDYIKNFSNIPKIFTVDTYHWITESNFYRPLFSLSLMLDYRLWQLNPFGYHLTNFALHLFNTFLVFCLVNLFTTQLKIPLIASLFYLVHPVHTQAVTYISGRADLLAFFFILTSVLFFAKITQKIGAGFKGIFYFLAAISFIFALLCKEIVLILPFILLLYDYCFGDISKRLKGHAVFFSIAVIYIIIRSKFMPFSSDGMLSESLFIKLINLPKVVIFYLLLLFFPWNLRIERPFPLSESLNLPVLLSAFILVVISRWIFRNRNKKVLLFSALWFFISLLPVVNIILPLNAMVADHWLYLPSVGFFIILAYGTDRLLSGDFLIAGYKASHRFKLSLLIIIITTLALLTISRNFEWRNPVVLFETTLKSVNNKTSPAYARIHSNLGQAYVNRGAYDKAILEFNEALKSLLPPQCKRVHYLLAVVYVSKSLYKEAEEQLIRALDADPDYISAYYLLSNVYKKTGQIDKADQALNKMLKIKPAHPFEEVLIKKILQVRQGVDDDTRY